MFGRTILVVISETIIIFQDFFYNCRKIRFPEISLGVHFKSLPFMRLLTCLFALGIIFLHAVSLHAQVVLFEDNFDNCSLAPGWTVSSVGNQNPVWYVGPAVQNDDNNGQSMNGSCFLLIDDDATGNNTPAYVIDFITPAFDASVFSKVVLTADIHYRDWADGQESFEVLLSDGTQETVLSRFDENRKTGNNLDEFVTLRYDISFISQSPNARIIFRYDDANAFNWWAAIDNVKIEGSGSGTNIIAEPFNNCTKPAGWETEVLTGNDDWRFGLIDTGAALNNGNSMDGSCFVFFDDDVIGNSAPYSVIRLKTPWFDGTAFSNFELNYDVILRYYSEKIRVFVQHGDGTEYLAYESNDDLGGPYFKNYISSRLDLTTYRAPQMRVVFEYDDGKDWGWWVGLDNIKVTGSGVANDVCANAMPIYSGLNCLPADNQNALFDGPPATCTERSSGGIWYRWKAEFSGLARFSTNANFNDVVSVFTGNCANPVSVLCQNKDEHGFTGEQVYFPVTQNTEYLLRVSGQTSGFGAPKGNMCVQIEAVTNAPAPPANDGCANAIPITVNAAATVNGNNLNAAMLPPQPTLNTLARADIWYSFTAPALNPGATVEIISNSNFSDIITVYSGTCAALTEVASNHLGQQLATATLTPGQTYRVQIAGNFSTVEGQTAVQVRTANLPAPPANENCATAQALVLGQACAQGSLQNATASGNTPTCVPAVGADVWFSFQTPVSGAVWINAGAEFEHILGIWKGDDCGQLENIACYKNPLYCDGGVLLSALLPGYTYYIQLAARDRYALEGNTGAFCLSVTDGVEAAPGTPLVLNVIEKCVSDNTAKLQIETSGGLLPYQFQGNPNNEILSAGENYLVVVRDARGCEASVSGVVKPCEAIECSIVASVSTTALLCHGGTDGSLTALSTGGLAPYTYLWSNGGNTATASNLPQGIYTVSITDALGCETTVSATLLAPLPITAVPTNIIQPGTGSSNGAIFMNISGGTGVYSFVWSQNGTTVSTAQDLTNAAAGDYTLQITDANNCTATFEFTLSEVVSGTDVPEPYYVEIFPNPAREKAWLSVSFAQPRTLHLSITDGNGRAVRTWTQRNVSEQNIPLDLKNLPAGNWQVVLRTDREIIRQTLIIVK
jgi:hypothetical protein